jgi:hypothetical protein
LISRTVLSPSTGGRPRPVHNRWANIHAEPTSARGRGKESTAKEDKVICGQGLHCSNRRKKFLFNQVLCSSKGIINNIVMDWCIVFHAGANKLNNCVWMPSFSLPTLNSLLRLVDEDTLMADWDMGEMFLNFQLHSNMVRFMGIDLGPLDFMPDKCSHQWMCWQRNLMGFRGSPYNLVKM